MFHRLRISMLFWVALSAHPAFGLTGEEVFETYRNRIFQIKVIDIESDSRSSIGSGFVVGDNSTIATNYHVISSYIATPSKYKIQVVSDSEDEWDVSVVDFDLVNDLALLRSERELPDPVRIAASEPEKGAEIFSVGNPYDIGMTLVPGTYNGRADNSYYDRIHFSGSVNAGMSGGPVFDSSGELVGVNVASAGNQVSFLVPANKLGVFLNQHTQVSPDSLFEHAQSQLLDNEVKLLKDFLEAEWNSEKLGEASVPGDLKGFAKCWGYSSRDEDDPDQRLVEIKRGCGISDAIYISRSMSTGVFDYQFSWYDGEELTKGQLTRELSAHMNWRAGNDVSREDVSKFRCEESFTDIIASSGVEKSFFCVRQYEKFPKLYDMVFFSITRRDQKALITHLTVSGVSRGNSIVFLENFLEKVSWP